MLAKRPLMFISLSFVAGMYILSVFDLADALFASIGTVCVLIVMLIRKFSVKNTGILLLCAISFLTGCIRYDTANNVKKRTLYQDLNTPITLTAKVLSEPKNSDYGISFVGRVINLSDKNETNETEEKVMFFCYFDETVENFKMPVLEDIVQIKDKIELPDSAKNTGGFDYAKYLKSDDIFFQCNTEIKNLEIIGRDESFLLQTWINFQNKCIDFFDKTFPSEEAGVLKAFILGDKSGITDEISKSFSSSGLSHILAVSGLHVAVFVSIIAFILKRLGASKRKQMIVSALGALFFILFTGASVSALRAGAMCILALIAKLIYRKADPMTTLSTTGAVFCIINPNVIYDASFMLSFSATAGILLFYETISIGFLRFYKKLSVETSAYRIAKNFFDSLAVGLSAQIFVIPLLVYIFNGFSTVSVIATMTVTPFLTYLLAGGLLFVAVSFISSTLAYPVGGFIYILAKIMIWISETFANLPFAKIIFGELTPFLVLMYGLVVGIFIFLIKRQKMGYIVFLLSFTILSVIGLGNLYENQNLARVSFINVGQGDCTLIKAPGDCDILIDAGGSGSSSSVGSQVIAPYLIKNGVKDVEYIIISHTDTDHTVGISGIIDTMNVENIIIPYGQQDTQNAKEIIKKAKQNGVNISYFTSGDVLKVNDEIRLTAITPDLGQRTYSKEDNDTGTALRVDYGDISFMFTGDMSSEIEKYLIKNYPDMLKADVLKVAHHGSKHSNSQEFLDAVKPEYAFIPVGENWYGHPTPETLERLKESGAKTFRADVHKDVTFYFDSEEIKRIVYDK